MENVKLNIKWTMNKFIIKKQTILLLWIQGIEKINDTIGKEWD